MTTITNLEIENESLVVIYDRATGRIVHAHEVVTLKGGRHPDAQERERDAREQLARAQPGAGASTEVLHADPRAFKRRALLRVDTASRELVDAE